MIDGKNLIIIKGYIDDLTFTIKHTNKFDKQNSLFGLTSNSTNIYTNIPHLYIVHYFVFTNSIILPSPHPRSLIEAKSTQLSKVIHAEGRSSVIRSWKISFGNLAANNDKKERYKHKDTRPCRYFPRAPFSSLVVCRYRKYRRETTSKTLCETFFEARPA